jgi:hypothetical protein
MITYKDGNGSTKAEAVVILGAKNEMEGVDAEYNWIEEKFGKQNIGWELNDQELRDEGIKQYDILRIKFPSGETTELWFDISAFYGK